jgi:hypothetical protein
MCPCDFLAVRSTSQVSSNSKLGYPALEALLIVLLMRTDVADVMWGMMAFE